MPPDNIKMNIQLEEPIQVQEKNTSSVELKRNSKGITEITVKVYNESPKEAAKEATTLLKSLNAKFPYQTTK